ncbi:MAG: LysR family transcriptional regulator [Planctomycetota bacterium]
MDRLLRLTRVWNHLPGFRAVAETEHLPSAAERLGVTPSALSRTVSAMERHLGRKLFDRRGRKLVLNEEGRQLLSYLRGTMRRFDDLLDDLQGEERGGPVRIASGSQLATSLVIACLPQLEELEPGLRPELCLPRDDPHAQLLKGEIDLYLSEFSPAPRALHVEVLGHYQNGVYCGEGHPLFRRRRLGVEELLQHPFVGPPEIAGPAPDNWPPELRREVRVHVEQLTSALLICAQGRYLSALPDSVVRLVGAGRLKRLPWDGMPPARIYATLRPILGPRDRAARVLTVLRAVAARVELEATG